MGSVASDARRTAVLGATADRVSVLNVLWEVVTAGAVGSGRGTDAGLHAADGLGDGWRVRVSADDVHVAWDAWLVARDGGAPAARVQDLRDDVDRLVRAVAQQHAEDVRASAVAPARERALHR